jgi:hypothetical protein
MQLASFLRVIAAIMGLCGVISTLMGAFFRAPHRVSRLSHLVSGMILIFSSFLGVILPLVFNLGQQSVFEDHYKIAIYAATALGLVISVFVYGFTAAFYDHREQRENVRLKKF